MTDLNTRLTFTKVHKNRYWTEERLFAQPTIGGLYHERGKLKRLARVIGLVEPNTVLLEYTHLDGYVSLSSKALDRFNREFRHLRLS